MGHSVLHLRSNFFTYRACINKSFCTSGGTERSAKVSTFLTLDVGNAHLILFRVPKNSQTSWFHDVAGTKHSAIRVKKKWKILWNICWFLPWPKSELCMIWYRTGKIILTFPHFCQLNEENQEWKNSSDVCLCFHFNFPLLEVPCSKFKKTAISK